MADGTEVVVKVRRPGAMEQVELDYLREARNAEQFAANFANNADVQIPRVFWEQTTSRMITLERIRGIKITDLAALDEAGIDRHDLAKRGTDVMVKMVFEDRFFHADPHPGTSSSSPAAKSG
jgi:ubiquinone biosynthesis protein